MKTLAMLVGLLAVASNAVGEDKVVKRSDAEEKAIAAIEKFGGRVTFDANKPGKPVISVDLSNTKVTDAGLVHLQGLTKLQELYLSKTNVTDAGVKKLQAELPKCRIMRKRSNKFFGF
jgi:hypothetical protein